MWPGVGKSRRGAALTPGGAAGRPVTHPSSVADSAGVPIAALCGGERCACGRQHVRDDSPARTAVDIDATDECDESGASGGARRSVSGALLGTEAGGGSDWPEAMCA